MAAKRQTSSDTKEWDNFIELIIKETLNWKDRLKVIDTETNRFREFNQLSQEASTEFQMVTNFVESSLKSSSNALKELIKITKCREKITTVQTPQDERMSTIALPASNMEDDTQDEVKNISLLMIGCSGNGKSATGNSIIGKNSFPENVSMSLSDTLSNIQMYSAKIDDIEVNVLDGPSIHTDNENVDLTTDLVPAMEESLNLCKYSFNAILIILKFGKRFTKEEAETIKIIKGILGKNVIKEYGICIVTHGDDFEREMIHSKDGESMEFQNWCRSQKGQVQSLFDECGYKCVLFDNQTKEAKKRLKQVMELRKFIDVNKMYSKDKFSKSVIQFLKLPIDILIPRYQQEIDKFILEQDNNCSNPDYKQLEEIISNIVEKIEEITAIGYNSETTQTLLQRLNMLKMQKELKLAELASRHSVNSFKSTDFDQEALEEHLTKKESEQSKSAYSSENIKDHRHRGWEKSLENTEKYNTMKDKNEQSSFENKPNKKLQPDMNPKNIKSAPSKSNKGHSVDNDRNVGSVPSRQEDYCETQQTVTPGFFKTLWDAVRNKLNLRSN